LPSPGGLRASQSAEPVIQDKKPAMKSRAFCSNGEGDIG